MSNSFNELDEEADRRPSDIMSPRNWKIAVVAASVVALMASVVIIVIVTRQGEAPSSLLPNFTALNRHSSSPLVGVPKYRPRLLQRPIVRDKNLLTNAPKNLILFVASGMGPGAVTFTRAAFNHTLRMDDMLSGSVITYAEDSWIADAAAGATALACGLKTNLGFVGTDPNGKACASIMEIARAHGRATGLVTNSILPHAAAGAFTSHSISRRLVDYIAAQQIEAGFDLLVGGGRNNFAAKGGLLENKAKSNGYHVVTTTEEFEALSPANLPALGLLAPNHIQYHMDLQDYNQPTLAEMTHKAIELLSTSKSNVKGFVLVVVAAKINFASQDNDPVALHGEVVALDSAVKIALEHAHKDEKTLVIVAGDHDSGGISLGRDGASELYPEYISNIPHSLEVIASELQNTPKNERAERLLNEYKFPSLSTEDIEEIEEAVEYADIQEALVGIVADHVKIQWTTRGNTGMDTYMYAAGHRSSEFKGTMENTKFGKLLRTVMAFDPTATQTALAHTLTQPTV